LARAEATLDRLEQDAVVLNERALALQKKGEPIEALDTILRAEALAPAEPAVLFNKALLLQELRIDGQATEAWAAFLEVEPAGPWADEARAHRDALHDAPRKARNDETQISL